jgi:tetratricopeptide (TPR) repeat protein
VEDPAPTRLFRRFLPENRAEIRDEIARDRLLLAEAVRTGDRAAELLLRGGIGFGLYVTEAETEAVPMLAAAQALATALGDRRMEIELLMHLATARQYCGDRALAQTLFQEALDLSRASGIDEFEHFIRHHQGRCYAETGEIAAARHCFEQALALRERLGIPRFIESSKAALADLASW